MIRVDVVVLLHDVHTLTVNTGFPDHGPMHLYTRITEPANGGHAVLFRSRVEVTTKHDDLLKIDVAILEFPNSLIVGSAVNPAVMGDQTDVWDPHDKFVLHSEYSTGARIHRDKPSIKGYDSRYSR